ncbi:MAG: cation transporter [Gemmatimonadaceae bacterium]|nr:cation transporter [Gemmatimonadaceae bacterium]
MTGGLLADSQALKADALDFIGDGLITFVGIVALTWHPGVRARVALIQGLFLGALGLGVLATTVFRVLIAKQPDAEVMGVLGAIGLAINLAAAAVLVPHRTGDVNARAIWLFSRNDALGNIAVVIAAASVAVTRSVWPDLVVAVVIASLFLHSSWSIVRRAAATLRTATG